MRDVYRKDVKKKVLLVLNILFGLYLINSKIPFIGTLGIPTSVNDILILVSGILLILNFLYLLLFSRRLRIY